MKAPNFVGVGSHKCGTTWWYHSLVCHPQINVATVPGHEYDTENFVGKQLHFFDKYSYQSFNVKQARDAYWTHFDRTCGNISGEWTPTYAASWWIPPLLSKCVDPETKILMTVRDPVVRYESSHAHHITHSVRERELKVDLRVPVWSEEAFMWGLFGQHVERLFKWFDPENILILQYEKMVRDPETEYRRTLKFLGVDSSFVPDDLFNRYNESKGGLIYKIPDFQRAALRSAYVEDTALLQHLVPEVDTTLWDGVR